MTNHIKVIGLGAGDIEQLPLGIYRLLKDEANHVVVRTMDHPVISSLKEEGIHFDSFDGLYEKYDQFQDVYQAITSKLIELASIGPVLYAVPGHPMLAEQTVQLLLENKSLHVEILGGQSYLDDLFTAARIDPIDGFQFVDATNFNRDDLCFRHHLIFCQVYDRFVASEVKLMLLEDLPPSYEVWLLEAVGTKGERKIKIPLEELDRVMEMSNLVSVYVPPVPDNSLHHIFSTLRGVIRELRGPDGCPWDKKQTHESLRPYLLEEVYELLDAIQKEDVDAMIEELGDVLLQVLLHSQIGEDEGYFSMDDVIKGLTDKMVHRHPHVFEPEKPTKTWEELKQEEKIPKKGAFLLDDILISQSALQVALEIQQKVAKVGFDWENPKDIWEKWKEEHDEFIRASKDHDKEAMEEEFGDMLFVLANIARAYHIHPEIALHGANKKFISRFREVETQMREQGITFQETNLNILNKMWDIAKQKERD